MATNRCYYIDFLKFVGLSLIILAHVSPPHLLFEFRSMDVPLMVFASGLAFSGKVVPDFIKFVIPRTKRLVVPVYFFLFVYFSAEFGLYNAGLIKDDISSLTTVLCSFALLNTKALHFVWIIRVFLFIMILTPVCLLIEKKCNKNSFVLLIIFLLISLELIRLLLGTIHPLKPLYYSIYETLPFALGYSVPFLVGLRLRYSDTRDVCFYILFFAILLLICFFFFDGNSEYFNVTKYKYPPGSYFICYGTFTSILLWVVRDRLKSIAFNKYITFIGQHTIWIYLYHIPILLFIEQYEIGWVERYCITYLMSVVLFSLQFVVITLIEKEKDIAILKYFKS